MRGARLQFEQEVLVKVIALYFAPLMSSLAKVRIASSDSQNVIIRKLGIALDTT